MIKAEFKNGSIVLSVFGRDSDVLSQIKDFTLISSGRGIDRSTGRSAWIIVANPEKTDSKDEIQTLLSEISDLKDQVDKLKKELSASKKQLTKSKKSSDFTEDEVL